MVLPGIRVGVMIDPTNPQKVSIDFSRINAGSPAGAGGPGAWTSTSTRADSLRPAR